ncbi:M3 family oligoendopeptidase [bacterium]|nr:M3 family oligoendopeptidase [bacterium]
MSEKKGVTWDLSSYFPAFNGPEMLEFKKQLEADIADLQAAAAKLAPLSAETMEAWEALALKAENLEARLSHIFSYVGCLSSADATDERYAQEEALLGRLVAEYGKFDVDVLRGLKGVSDEIFEQFLAREKLQGAEHSLRKTRERAQHTMSDDQEKLATDLAVDGFHSWGRLYDTVTGKLEFDMVYPDGRSERTPISQWRSLMSHVDREVGKAAFDCGNKAWRGIEDVCAAALNAIAGNRLTLNKYRGIDSYLYKALFQSNITRETLDAMYEAIHANIDVAREIFRAKAGFMGRSGIHWFEREAPLPLKGDTSGYSWPAGTAMVTRAFDTAYPELSKYYQGFLNKRWLESEVRPGKRPGAFCTGSPVTGEQRVYMTFNGTLSDVTTMAHEVGHAWHGHLLKELRPMAQEYPMTLAETASIFAEHILAQGIYEDADVSDDAKLLMLDADLCGSATLLLDITVRFEFEKAFHDERMKGEVSVSRLKQLMVEAQQKVMGDAMLAGSEDEMFWASKLHFYITGVTFYNFPYTFGFLLARALFNLFTKEGPSFLPKYEDFLRLTGSDTAEQVALKSIGADITKPDFWAESINSLKPHLVHYKELLAKKQD